MLMSVTDYFHAVHPYFRNPVSINRNPIQPMKSTDWSMWLLTAPGNTRLHRTTQDPHRTAPGP